MGAPLVTGEAVMPFAPKVILICIGLTLIAFAVVSSGRIPHSRVPRIQRKNRLALAFLGALLVIGSGVLLVAPGTERPLGGKGKPTPSATPSLHFAEALNMLAYHAVPDGEWDNCLITGDVPPSATAVVCGKSGAPGRAKYIAFPTVKAMRAYFDATASPAPAKNSPCNSLEDYYTNGGYRNIGKPGVHGKMACFWRVSEFWIVWTYDDYKIAGLAKMNASEDDLAKFFDWVLKGIRK